MILVHNGFHMSDDKCYRFSCLFEEVSVPCTVRCLPVSISCVFRCVRRASPFSCGQALGVLLSCRKLHRESCSAKSRRTSPASSTSGWRASKKVVTQSTSPRCPRRVTRSSILSPYPSTMRPWTRLVPAPLPLFPTVRVFAEGSHDGYTGRLSLAWELVGHNDILSVMKHFKYTAKELDLSNNGLAYGPTTAF